MTEFKLWKNNFVFEDDIRMKHLRVLMPYIKKMEAKEISEIDLVCEASKIFFVSMNWENNLEKFSEELDNLKFTEVTEFSEKISEIIIKATSPEKKNLKKS